MKKLLYFLVLLLSFFHGIGQDYTLRLSGSVNQRVGPPFQIGSAEVLIDGTVYRDYSDTNVRNSITINETNIITGFTSFQLKADGIIGNFPPACEQRNETTVSNLNSRIISPSTSITACGVSSITAVLMPNIGTLNRLNGSGDLCIGAQLSLSAPPNFPNVAYNWQYSTNGTDWIDFPATFNLNRQISATIEEIIGNTHEDFLETDIQFRVGGYNKGQFSDNTLTVSYSACAPLVSDINYSPPNCTGDPINVIVSFNRPLQDDENFASISLVDINGGPEIEPFFNVSMDTPNGNTFTFSNIDTANLIDGQTFEVRYQMQRNNVQVPGFINSAPNQIFTFIDTTPVTFSSSKTDISCVTGQGTSTNGSISISGVSGGTSSYEYSIDNGANYIPFAGNSITLSNQSAGNYTIRVQDTNGCDGTSGGNVSVTQTINAATAITIVNTPPVNVTLFGGNNGSIAPTVSGGTTPPLSYSWTGPNGYTAATQNIAGLFAGTYTLTVTDTPEGCSTSRQFMVSEPDELIFDTISSTNIDCNAANNGTISVTASGGLPNYQFQLLRNDGTGTFNPIIGSTLNTTDLSTTAFNINALSPGEYQVRLTDNIGSGNTSVSITTPTITITEPDAIEFNITNTTDALCMGEATGTATVTVNGGSGSYNFRWTRDSNLYSTQQNPTNFEAGTYLLTVTDAVINNCSAITPTMDSFITIGQPPTRVSINTLTVTSPTDGNANGSITVQGQDGTPGYRYLWNTGATTPTISNLVEDTYTVTVTDDNGCDDNETFTLTALSVSTSITPGEEVFCSDDTAGFTANPIGGDNQYTYAWFNTNNLTAPIESDALISGLVDGDYVVIVTDGTGTSVTSATVNVDIPDPITIGTIADTAVSCFGGSGATLIINGASGGTETFEYSIDNGTSYQPSNTFTGLTAITYDIIVRDTNQCESIVQQHTIAGPTSPITIVENTITDVTIFGQNTGAIDLDVSGGNAGFTYSWTGPNGFTAATQNITALFAGTYILVVTDNQFNNTTDNAGCTATSSFPVGEPQELLVTIDYETPDTDLQCNGDDNARILATVIGGTEPYTYSWSKETTVGSGIFEPILDLSPLLIGADAGNYRVQITDMNAAMANDQFIVTEPEELIITYTTTDIICFGDATGAIDITITGGTPPYEILWEDDITTNATRVNLIAGTYQVTAIDNNDCSESVAIDILHQYQELAIINEQVTNVSTFEGNDGSINLDIIGGLEPYAIVWERTSDNAIIATTPAINTLTADEYIITITDANNPGCTIQKSYTITQPDIVEPTFTLPTCVEGCDGAIEVLVNEGNGNFTYLWSTGADTSRIENICAGTYTVIIQGFDNRTLERAYILEDPEELIIDLGEDKTLCLGQSYTIDATIDDPLASYLWQGDNGFTANTPQVTLSQSGNYTVVVTTGLGCTSADTIEIIALQNQINSEFLVSTDLFVNESFVIVDVSNPLPDTIEWILPQQAQQIEITDSFAEIQFNEVGTYEIGLRTTAGDCEAVFTKTIEIREPNFDRDIDSNPGLQEYIMFPNPTNGNFTIEMSFDQQTPIDIKIFNIANNSLLHQYQEDGKTTYSIPFNLEGILPSGIYFVLLETPQQSLVRKIVVE